MRRRNSGILVGALLLAAVALLAWIRIARVMNAYHSMPLVLDVGGVSSGQASSILETLRENERIAMEPVPFEWKVFLGQCFGVEQVYHVIYLSRSAEGYEVKVRKSKRNGHEQVWTYQVDGRLRIVHMEYYPPNCY